MKKTILFFFFCIVISSVHGQKNGSVRQLSFNLLYARHGSGDMDGVAIELGYEFSLGKKLSFYNDLAFTLHSQKEMFYALSSDSFDPNYPTEPLNFVTAGIQTSPTLYWNFLKNEKQNLKIGGGTVIRYQANSFPDAYNFYYRPDRWREPFYVIKDVQPSVLTIGYKLSLEYVFLNTSKILLGAKAFYQNDTNGDLLAGFGVSIKRKLGISVN